MAALMAKASIADSVAYATSMDLAVKQIMYRFHRYDDVIIIIKNGVSIHGHHIARMRRRVGILTQLAWVCLCVREFGCGRTRLRGQLQGSLGRKVATQ